MSAAQQIGTLPERQAAQDLGITVAELLAAQKYDDEPALWQVEADQ